MKVQVYNHLLDYISETFTDGKVKAFNAANIALVETYWKIGQHIVEFEQDGNAKAEYGAGLLEKLSKDLSLKFGKGFSLSNIKRFRQFYIVYQKGAEPSHQLQSNDNQINTIGATVSHQLGNKNLNLKGATVSRFLNWSHYVELLKIESPIERNFYENQSLIETQKRRSRL